MHSLFKTALLTLAIAGEALGRPKSAQGLDSAIKAKGKQHVGTALTLGSDSRTEDIIKGPSEFGAITPENAMKWQSVQPRRGEFTFSSADQHANFAVNNNKELRCHTLVWHSQLAPWVEAGNFDNQTLVKIMEDHINTVAGRYRGKCTHWDVVNEALNEDGSYRQTVWYKTIGEAYIPMAFRLAAKADPNAKLWYNDYNLEYNNAKTAGAARIVKLIQSYGVKIDGVGLQGHLVVEPTPTQPTITPSRETLEGALRKFTDLGVFVEYTEVDIRMKTPATKEKLEEQSKAYQRVVESCMAVKKCIGITLWGVSDKYSWIPSTFQGEGAALVWDEEFQKKPAYSGILNAIKAAKSKWWY
ncbi:NAD(P)H-dependent D-xylose reductase (XR) [Fusarium solani]|nr:NAD(P)H-dependent D-xylose reductase (XR) [Fusarium solani]